MKYTGLPLLAALLLPGCRPPDQPPVWRQASLDADGALLARALAERRCAERRFTQDAQIDEAWKGALAELGLSPEQVGAAKDGAARDDDARARLRAAVDREVALRCPAGDDR